MFKWLLDYWDNKRAQRRVRKTAFAIIDDHPATTCVNTISLYTDDRITIEEYCGSLQILAEVPNEGRISVYGYSRFRKTYKLRRGCWEQHLENLRTFAQKNRLRKAQSAKKKEIEDWQPVDDCSLYEGNSNH